MFLVLVAIMLFTIFAFMAILVDIYILLQTQMDMKIAAQMMADGGLRYMTDEKTWEPDRSVPPNSISEVESMMMKLAEESFLIGYSTDVNFNAGQVEMKDGIYKVKENESKGVFDDSVSFPASLEARQSPPTGAPVGEFWYWGVRVKIKTESGSGVAAIFARIMNATDTDINTYGIAYLNSSNPSGVSGYAFEN